MTIPESAYVQSPNGPRVTDEIFLQYHTQAELDAFREWMIGQTCDEYGVYPCDYELWARRLPVKD